MNDDSTFELLIDVYKMLESNKVWGGQDWSYHPIHPIRYLPVKDKVREALDAWHNQHGDKNVS